MLSLRQLKQRDEEQRFARTFVKLHWGDSSPPTIEHRDAPEPDIALVGSRTIGLEITKVFTSNEDKADDSVADRVVENACARFSDMGGPPLWVSFIWNQKVSKPRANQAELERVIADFVMANTPPIDGSSSFGTYENPFDLPPEPLAHMSIHRPRSLDRPLWSNTWCVFVPDLDKEKLANRIAAKDSKPKNYSMHYDEIWLLVVLEGISPSSFVNLPDALLQATYSTAYDRLFLAEFIEGKIHKLSVRSRLESHRATEGGQNLTC